MRIKLFLPVLILLAWGSCRSNLFAQIRAADTLRFRLDPNAAQTDVEIHYDDKNALPLSVSIPVKVPHGLQISAYQLLVDETLPAGHISGAKSFDTDFRLELQSFDSRNNPACFLVVRPMRSANGTAEQLLAGRLVVQYDSLTTHQKSESQFTSSSVLSKGPWLKVAVTATAVYRITPEQLAAAGWNPAQIDPRRLALFGNGGAMLPERNNAFRYDDLVENPVVVTGEADGSFDPGDALYFYGQSPVIWTYNQMSIRYDHRINHYTDTTYYFLTELERPGMRLATRPQLNESPNMVADIFLDYALHENDLENLIHSGREWYGERFSQQNDRLELTFYFPNRVAQRPVMFNTQFAVRSFTETTSFSVEVNGQTALAPQTFLPITSGASTFAREQAYGPGLNVPPNDSLRFTVRYSAAENNSVGWINFFRVNAWRQLKYIAGRQMPFRNPEAIGFNTVTQYQVSDTRSGLWLWDVTNPIRPFAQQYDLVGNQLRFTIQGDSIREYHLFDPVDAVSPALIRPIANQNLHGIQAADMIIVAPPQFVSHAQAIANLHLQHDGLESVVVSTDEVYNEFGSGKPDITAIRDFIRMVYLRGGERLRYVLLFGDASYDYKNRIPQNTNLIPTYQSAQSMIETQSFASDDYFGLMGSTEGQDMQGVLDLGIGRFPVSTPEEAGLMVEKNARYLSGLEALRGAWQNQITFMADDADGNLHLSQAETLAADVEAMYKNFNIKKIYLDAYRRIAVPGGFRYPDASAALLKTLGEGSLIVNYTGHGGVSGLTDEKVFSVTEIEGLTNLDRLAFFVTATCEFSRFDNPKLVSAGERLLLNPRGGAIALMTTTRLAFAHSNFNVNRKLYASLMDQGSADINRLGDIIRLSKTPTNVYIYNFALLGNPALRLSYPEFGVELETVNGLVSDTLHAMSEVLLQGRIKTPAGPTALNFNGFVQVMMFDKKTTYRTLGNDPNSIPANFSLFDKLLFKGTATVVNGRFSIRFLLPRSISFNYGKPRISFFASDQATGLTAGGYFDNLVLGGTDTSITPDANGPEIQLTASDANFKDGGVLPSDATFIARITDPQGISYLGTEIGRDIVATHMLPDASVRRYVLNSLFEPEKDNFTTGMLSFRLTDLMQGAHRLTLRAWDLHNNSSEKTISFVVNPPDHLRISNVQVAPNPASSEAVFTFEHNKPGKKLFVNLELFDVLGNKVYGRRSEIRPAGSLSEPIFWRVSDVGSGRLPPGVYLWRLIVQPEEGLAQTVSGRIVLQSH